MTIGFAAVPASLHDGLPLLKTAWNPFSSQAAKQALEQAGWRPEQVDLILLATSSPEDLFGSAPAVQAALGASNAVAFDLTAACSGFLFALITAAQYIRSGTYRRVLVVGG